MNNNKNNEHRINNTDIHIQWQVLSSFLIPICKSHSAYHADYTVCHKAEHGSLDATKGWNTATDCFGET
jgi:hypothetical protein